MKYQKLTAALMSGALALSIGLVGCGGGSGSTETSTEAETSVVEETSATEKTTSEISYNWDVSYMGVGESGETFYYAEDHSDPENLSGLMVVLDPDTGKYVSFVGPITNPSDTQVTIADESTGNTLTFEVIASEDGTIAVDLGETGKAVLEKCTADEVNAAFNSINANGEAVA